MTSTDSTSSITETEDSECEDPITQISSSDTSNGDQNSASSVVEEGIGDRTVLAASKDHLLNNSIDLTDVTELESGYEDMLGMFKQPMCEESQDSETNTDDKDNSEKINFDSKDWYKHRLFQRYWTHYRQSMDWCKKHTAIRSKLQAKVRTNSKSAYINTNPYQNWGYPVNYPSSYPFVFQPQFYNPYQDYASQGIGQTSDPYHQVPGNFGKSPSQRRKRRKNRKKRSSSFDTASSRHSESVETENSEMFEMEITQDMVEFFTKSEEHRKQREKDKLEELNKEQEGDRVNVEEVHSTSHSGHSLSAPKERPGARRTAEMKVLYGKGAAMIHGMETALQMKFDRNVDLKQPKMWPNMPLRLIF